LGKIAVLINPSAGKGRAAREMDHLKGLLGKHDVDHDLTITSSEEELRMLAREISRNYGVIAGAGGDSTFHIMANEMLASGAESSLGMIPLGSSNDIAKEFGVETVEKACGALKKGGLRRIDVGCIAEGDRVLRYFLGQANIGLGALVNQYVERLAAENPRLARHQTLAGILGIRNALRSGMLPLQLKVNSDKGSLEGEFLLAVFSTIRYWATGRMISPQAVADDGLLDACLISKCSLLRLACLAGLAKEGRHCGAGEVCSLQSASFEVSSRKPFEIQTDGEILGGRASPARFGRVTFRVLPKALSIVG
jgi:diacylglycerol kinase (ATP)